MVRLRVLSGAMVSFTRPHSLSGCTMSAEAPISGVGFGVHGLGIPLHATSIRLRIQGICFSFHGVYMVQRRLC